PPGRRRPGMPPSRARRNRGRRRAPVQMLRTRRRPTAGARTGRPLTRRASSRAVPPSTLIHDAQQALLLVLAVSLPVLGVAAVVGLVVAAFQAASQIQDPTLAHLPRLLAVIAAVALLGPWMGHEVAAFAQQMFSTH